MAEIDLVIIENEVKAGLPRVKSAWEQFGRESAYYLNQGHKLIPARESEQALDKQLRPKLALHITSRVVNELAKGLYTQPGPSRQMIANQSADQLVQAVAQEHRVNRQLHKADAYTWLHGVCGVQVVPYVDVVHRRHTGESVIKGSCPVQFRIWTADQFTVWTDDQDPAYPIVVVTRSQIAGRERLQLWTDSQVRTYMGVRAQSSFNPYSKDRFELDSESSGVNPFGVIPFAFCHNEDPSDNFWTPGIGYSLTNTAYWLDQVLSDLTQAVEVFCIPEKYSRNLSVSARLVHRPGDPMDLVERDPSKNADIFFAQPKMEVEATWLHIENTLNEALVGMDVPIRIEVQSTSQPESGIALIIRRTPLLDRWRERQDQFKHFEHDLWRTAAQVAVVSLNDPGLVGANSLEQAVEIIKGLEVGVDFPEASFPIPSTEKDASDDWELAHGIKSRVQCVMERYGKTRTKAIEHIKQVAEDEAAVGTIGSMPTVPAQPPLKIVGRDVGDYDFSASAASDGLDPVTAAPGRFPAQPPEASDPGATAAYQAS